MARRRYELLGRGFLRVAENATETWKTSKRFAGAGLDGLPLSAAHMKKLDSLNENRHFFTVPEKGGLVPEDVE